MLFSNRGNLLNQNLTGRLDYFKDMFRLVSFVPVDSHSVLYVQFQYKNHLCNHLDDLFEHFHLLDNLGVPIYCLSGSVFLVSIDKRAISHVE